MVVQPQSSIDPTKPLNLGLNDGTYMPQACVDALRRYTHRLSLRNYSTADNDPLRETIARIDGVKPDNIFLHNGSGPILKQVVPHIIRERIKSSPMRVFKHLTSKNGFPIITPSFTYCKVPRKATEIGLQVHFLPVGPDDDFKLDPRLIDATLRKGDGMVYIVNPNNPTGRVMITRDDLIPLLERYPESRFWIDEAYVQYVDPKTHRPVSDLVTKHPNLMVSRTFSFAYGLASARIGYLLADPSVVHTFEKQLTDYRIGGLQEELAVAALEDPDHLGFIRAECARERARLSEGMARISGVQVFPSDTNFVFARFTDGRTGVDLQKKLKAEGILIKSFEPILKMTYDSYFRITLGTSVENEHFLDRFTAALS